MPPKAADLKQRAEVIGSIRRFFSEKLELELSELQAGFILDYFSAEIAPFACNEGVADAQKFLVRLCEDLPSTCFQKPLTYWDVDDKPQRVRRKPDR
jgi:uncharacterized protein (DUF2164 family)